MRHIMKCREVEVGLSLTMVKCKKQFILVIVPTTSLHYITMKSIETSSSIELGHHVAITELNNYEVKHGYNQYNSRRQRMTLSRVKV